MQDIDDRDLTYAMMAKLSLAAAEEHVGKPARDAGIVALYAKVRSKTLSPDHLRLWRLALVCTYLVRSPVKARGDGCLGSQQNR